MAVQRVAMRVRQGGHDIPEPVIHRRFTTGKQNFLNLYKRSKPPAYFHRFGGKSLADAWRHYDNAGELPVLLASSHAP